MQKCNTIKNGIVLCFSNILELFATNLAIQCTEVFEYAMSLGNHLFSLPTFQAYKLLYAYRLADIGMAEEVKITIHL